MEQAALAKVYEGILGLQAARNLKDGVGGANADDEASPDPLAKATANLIKAFEVTGETDIGPSFLQRMQCKCH